MSKLIFDADIRMHTVRAIADVIAGPFGFSGLVDGSVIKRGYD